MDKSSEVKEKNRRTSPQQKSQEKVTVNKPAPKNIKDVFNKQFDQKQEKIDRQELKRRLTNTLDTNSETGHELVSVFAARCALRVFPSVLTPESSRSVDESADSVEIILEAKERTKMILVVWRALLSGYFFDKKMMDKADVLVKSAYAAAVAYADTPAADAYSAAYSAVDYAFTISYLIDTASNAAFYAAENIHEESFIYDELEKLGSKGLSPASYRQNPLWLNQSIPESLSSWEKNIAALVKQLDDETEIKALEKIRRDYQALLDGAWHDAPGNLSNEPVVLNSAVEKAEDDSPSADDFLGRDKLVSILFSRISVADDANHLTVGLLGNWGIGKSSVIEQLQKELDQNPDASHSEYLFGEFNAWSYEKTQNLQAGITHEMISALTSARSHWPWYRRWFYKPLVIAEFAARLHGWRIVTLLVLLLGLIVSTTLSVQGELPGFAGALNIDGWLKAVFGAGSLAILVTIWPLFKTISAEPLAKELKTYLRLPSYLEYLGKIPVMEKHIKVLCEICLNRLWSFKQRRLVFFIDDLDRCGVDGIVQTFEAVRLVLGIRWVTVIIAMDQRIALPALACHYKQLSEFHQHDPMSIARDYLGKVIHLPVSMTPPDNMAVAQYLSFIWKDPDFYLQRKPMSRILSEKTVKNAGSGDEKTPGIGAEAPEESVQDIINDINKQDIRKALMENKDVIDQGWEPASIEKIKQLSESQKEAFYIWLLKLNLRNPRQIKRLYNSFNLLWSTYEEDWASDDYDHPYMIGLFVLEMINEFVAYEEASDTKNQIREDFFSIEKEVIHMPKIDSVSFDDLSAARKIIFSYQSQQPEVKLLSRIEPFVLPASSPQNVDKISS